MTKPKPYVVAACGGALTSIVWLLGAWFDRDWWPYAFLWVPTSVLVALFAVSFGRRQFVALRGYWVGLLYATLIVPAALLALFLLYFLGHFALRIGVTEAQGIADRFQRRPFVDTVWREHGGDRTRARMVDDLLASRRLEGLSVQEARSLLGPPDDNYGSPADGLAYWLSTDRGWLYLSLSGGRVARVTVRPYDD